MKLYFIPNYYKKGRHKGELKGFTFNKMTVSNDAEMKLIDEEAKKRAALRSLQHQEKLR